jgi:MraZ protein
MLIGEFETKVTDKSRVALPKKFREELGKKLIVMQGYEGCMILVNQARFEALTNEIVNGRFINDAVRDTTRFLVGSAHEIELDKQGRFILPQSLRNFTNVKSDVTFLGLIRWVEIWDSGQWNKRKKFISENAGEISKSLDQGMTKEPFKV